MATHTFLGLLAKIKCRGGPIKVACYLGLSRVAHALHYSTGLAHPIKPRIHGPGPAPHQAQFGLESLIKLHRLTKIAGRPPWLRRALIQFLHHTGALKRSELNPTAFYMDLMTKRRRKGKSTTILKNPIALTCLTVSICCIFILTISSLKLPGISKSRTVKARESASKILSSKFGEMVVEMLPTDLAFTVFLPSKKAFERDLRLRPNDTVMPQDEADNVYATLTRVLGFSVIPRKLYSDSVSVGEEILLDSVSGFRLYVTKDLDGSLIVNKVKSEKVDMRKGEIVVHLMDGVIMDAEFAQSVQPDDDEEEHQR
ncbi:hypothetical protein V2J09_014221 [Rumex salicifolius]